MLAAIKQITVKNGEFPVNTASTGTDKYYGGSPLAINTSGQLELCKSGSNFIGIAAKSSYEDMEMTGARGVGTFYSGPGLFRMTTFSASAWTSHQTPTALSNEGYPYLTTDNWDEGDDLFIDSDGKWTNSNPGAQTTYGKVIAVGDSNAYLDVLLFAGH